MGIPNKKAQSKTTAQTSEQESERAEIDPRVTRRRALTHVVGGSIVSVAALPDSWVRPIIDTVVLPAHAQTSPGTPAGGSSSSGSSGGSNSSSSGSGSGSGSNSSSSGSGSGSGSNSSSSGSGSGSGSN